MSFPHNLIYGFNTIPTKIPESYFMDVNKLTPKLIWRAKDKMKSLNNIDRKEEIWRTNATCFKTSYKATVIKAMWFSRKNSQNNGTNREPRNRPM